jgi:hypothetical protein
MPAAAATTAVARISGSRGGTGGPVKVCSLVQHGHDEKKLKKKSSLFITNTEIQYQ